MFRSIEARLRLTDSDADLLENRSLSRQLSTYTDTDPQDTDPAVAPVIDAYANPDGIEIYQNGLVFSAVEGTSTPQATVALLEYDPKLGVETTGNYFEIYIDLKVQ